MSRGWSVSLVERKRSPFWYARIYIEGEGGRDRWWSTEIRVGTTGRERKESRRLATRAAEDHAAGIVARLGAAPAPEPEDSLGEVAKRTLAAKQADGRRPRAVESLAWYLDKHVLPYFGRERAIGTFRRADLEAFKAHLRKAGYAAQTINNALNAVRAVLKHACAIEERIESVPTFANVFRDPTPKGRALTEDECARLLAAFSPKAHEALQYATILANTALRRDEALSLRWSWIDWAGAVINIPAENVKKGKARPPVALNDIAIGVLRAREKVRREGDDRVWFQRDHYHALRSAAKAAGVGRVTFHDLRYTRGSLLHAAGVPLPEVRDTLGHRTLAMVNHYAQTYSSRSSSGLAASIVTSM